MAKLQLGIGRLAFCVPIDVSWLACRTASAWPPHTFQHWQGLADLVGRQPVLAAYGLWFRTLKKSISANELEAKGFQLDWATVNQIAKYDFAIYGHIAHPETPAANVEIFRKFRRAIKPGVTLVVNDLILSDDRTGHSMAMLFAAQMLLVTEGGFTWRQSDYRKWLGETGFASVDIVPTPTPSTLVFAR